MLRSLTVQDRTRYILGSVLSDPPSQAARFLAPLAVMGALRVGSLGRAQLDALHVVPRRFSWDI